MVTKDPSSLVWPIVVMVVAAIVCVTIACIFASVQVGVIVGVCSSVILPVVMGLLNLMQQSANHTQTTTTLDGVKDTLAARIRNGS